MYRTVDYKKPESLQSVQLSNLLHHLTNTVSDALKRNTNTLYYDIRKSVPRAIMADYESLKKTLEELFLFFSSNYSQGEILFSLTKEENFLMFNITYSSAIIRNTDAVSFPKISYGSIYNDIQFFKTDIGLVNCTFSIPYYENENESHYANALQDILHDKKVLFVGKNRNELKIIHYIFQTYGMEIDFVTPQEFKEKKPNLEFYDMVLLRSVDLSPLQISIFKNLDQKNKKTKIIVMHDIFVTREQRKNTLPIAYAEIFRPAIIGDVEDILRQIYIDGVMINKVCCNTEMQKLQTFTVSDMKQFEKNSLDKFVGKTVLIVDSSPIQLRIVKNMLEVDGLHILTAKDGEEALSLVKRKKVDLIFSEINLAELDGCSLAKKLKKESKFAHIPLVAMSALSFDYELMKMLDHGIVAHIPVPFKNDHFYNAIHRHMSGRLSGAQLNATVA